MPKLVQDNLSEADFVRIKAQGSYSKDGVFVEQMIDVEAHAVELVAEGSQQADTDGDKEKEEDAKDKQPLAVPLSSMFRFASRSELALTITGCFFAVIQGAFMPFFALFMGELIDTFANGENCGPGEDGSAGYRVHELSAGLVLIGGIAMIAGFFQGGLLQVSAVLQQPKLKQAYLAAVMRQDITWMDLNPAGKVQSTIAQDMDLYTDAIGEKLGETIQTLVQFFLGLAVGFYVSWRLSLLTLGLMPFLAFTMGALMTTVVGVQGRMQKVAQVASSITQESMSAIRTVCSLTMQDSLSVRYAVEAEKIKVEAQKFHSALATSLGGFFFVIYCAYAMAMWYGSILVEDGTLTGGEILTVFWAILVGGLGLATLGGALGTIGKGRQAAHSIFETLDRVPAIDSSSTEGRVLQSCEGGLELRDVDFAYPTRPEQPIFKGYNLKVSAGQTVALVGESGGGKSTVISLLERFYDPSQGQVLLDGTDIRDLNVQWLRDQIGLVNQEPALFAASIMENIRHGKRDATDEEVFEAARMANAHSFISSFPEGYATEVGERGVQLSGGQKQRVAIARAVIKDPTILLLDEATSALDNESERVVQEALDSLMKAKKRTTIVVAHRLSTVRNADSIAVVYNGAIVEQGSYDELAANPESFFSNLLLLQNIDTPLENAHGAQDDVIRVQASLVSTSKKVAVEDSDLASQTSIATANKDMNVLTINLETADRKQVRELELGGLLDTTKNVKRRLWEMHKPVMPHLLAGFAGSFVNGLCEPVMGLLFALMMSAFYMEDTDDMRAAANVLALLFVGLAFVMLGANLLRLPFGIATSSVSKRLRVLFFNSILNQDVEFHDSLPPGVLTAQLGHDIALVERAHDHALSTKISLAGTIVGMFTICLIFSWEMTLVLLVVVPLVGISGMCAKAWWLRKKEDESKKIEAGLVTEAVSSARTVVALRLQPFISDLYLKSLVKPQQSAIKDALITSLNSGLSHVISMACYGFVFTIGAELKERCVLTNTEMLVSVFVIMFAAPSLGRQSASLPDELAGEIAAARLFKIIDRVPTINASSSKGKKPRDCQGELELRDVDFAYPTRPEQPIFKGYNLKVSAGQTVALVGESGGGKSTVISLLERFYDPSQGQVLLDGTDIRDLNVQWLRDQVSLVSQEPILFATSILENIRHGKRDATDEEVFEAARMANAHSFISSFPEGYATEVGERGVQLSGGQKQRVAIARAVIKDPTILLLDEATSALDSESEVVVQEALDSLMKAKKRTTIVVAHRLSTVRNADSIAVVYNGAIVEQGTHDELMAISGGNYHRLAQRQQQNS